jgi:hypothetical protein
MTLARLIAVIVVSAFSLSACKKETAPAASPEVAEAPAETSAQRAAPLFAVDPCTLLTADEIIASVGDEVQVEHSVTGGAPACTWLAPSGRTVVVRFHHSPDGDKETIRKMEPLERGEVATFSFPEGEAFVIVQVIAPDKTTVQLETEARGFAKAIADRL